MDMAMKSQDFQGSDIPRAVKYLPKLSEQATMEELIFAMFSWNHAALITH